MKNKDTQLKMDFSTGSKKGLKEASKLQTKVQRRIAKVEAKLRSLRDLSENLEAFVRGASSVSEGPARTGSTTPKGRLRKHGDSIAAVLKRGPSIGLTTREIARKLHTPESGIRFPKFVDRTSQHLTRLKSAGKVELSRNGKRSGRWALAQ